MACTWKHKRKIGRQSGKEKNERKLCKFAWFYQGKKASKGKYFPLQFTALAGLVSPEICAYVFAAFLQLSPLFVSSLRSSTSFYCILRKISGRVWWINPNTKPTKTTPKMGLPMGLCKTNLHWPMVTVSVKISLLIFVTGSSQSSQKKRDLVVNFALLLVEKLENTIEFQWIGKRQANKKVFWVCV